MDFFPKMLVVFSCDYGRIGQNFHLEVVAKGLKELSKCLTLNIQTQTHGVLSYVPCTRHMAGQRKFMRSEALKAMQFYILFCLFLVARNKWFNFDTVGD